MSESYRRLIHIDPAPEPAQPSSLPGDVRRIKAWLADLPWANPDVACGALHAALHDLAGRGGLGGSERFAASELVRRPVLDVIAIIERRFLGVALPLPATGVAAARQVEALHRLLADSFRRAAGELCAPAGSVPMLRSGKVVQALERASFHYSQALAVAWSTYRAPAPGTWCGLHRCHFFAEGVGIDGKKAGDPSVSHVATIALHRLRTLLVALANPYAYDQDDQGLLWRLSTDYASHSSLRAFDPSQAEAAHTAVVAIDADRGPGGAGGEAGPQQLLEFSVFAHDVAEALDGARDGAGKVSLGRSRGSVHELSVGTLRQLRRAFGQRSAREHERLPGGHELEVVIGLTGLHLHLAGRDFEDFVRQSRDQVAQVGERAGWAQPGGEMARAPLVPAHVLDQGLGGYRLAFRDEGLVRARVGELIGLSWPQPPEQADLERDWLVGVVRWLRYEPEGGVSAGVELLSRRADPVAFARVDAPGEDASAPVRAIELGMALGIAEGSFVVSSAERVVDRVEILGLGDAGSSDGGARLGRMVAAASAGEYLVMSGQPESAGALR